MTAKELLKRIADGDKAAIAENKAAFVGVCAFCGVEFDKRRPDQEYCKKACRIAFHWRKKAEAEK